MPLLGNAQSEYEVVMMDDFENLVVDYVLAPDVETAAWQAYKLSSRRNLLLKDVRLCDEW